MRLLALLLLGLLPPAALAGQVTEDATVTVTGTGTVERFPDRAVITLRIERSGASIAEALSEHTALFGSVVDRVRAISGTMTEVRGRSPSVWPRRVWGRRPPEVADTLFVASIHLTATVASLGMAVRVLNELPELEPPPSLSGEEGRVEVSVRLTGQDPDPGLALQSAGDQQEEVMAAVQRAGVDPAAVRTSYRLSREVSRSRPGRPEPRQEYRAYSSVEVTVDSLALLTRVMDAVRETEAEVTRLSYGLKDHETALADAYERAVRNAGDHATALAAAAGARLGEVRSIRFPVLDGGWPVYQTLAAEESAESPLETPPTPIEVRRSIIVEYRLDR